MTDKPPRVSGAHRVYLPRKHRTSVFWAYWSAERHQWSLPYCGGVEAPAFDSMESGGRLEWSAPGVMLRWMNDGVDEGSDAHLARAVKTGD